MNCKDKHINHGALIKQLKNGQEVALKQLFDLYSDDIYGIAYSILKDSLESEDVVQEVFIRLWNTRLQLDETGNIWSYLYVVTKRLSLNKLRDAHAKIKDRVASISNDFIQDSSCDANVHIHEILALEYEVLKKLPDQQKKAYLLSRVDGLTHKQIAHQMNIAPNTVKNHIIQALKTFKKHFQKFGYPLFLFFFNF